MYNPFSQLNVWELWVVMTLAVAFIGLLYVVFTEEK